MRPAMRWLLSAALAVTAAPAMAQAPLNFNDLVGVWNLMYEDGQTGTFTFSKNTDGTPKVVVSTMAGGESVAKEVVIKGDTITFTRDIAVQGLSGSVDLHSQAGRWRAEGHRRRQAGRRRHTDTVYRDEGQAVKASASPCKDAARRAQKASFFAPFAIFEGFRVEREAVVYLVGENRLQRLQLGESSPASDG